MILNNNLIYFSYEVVKSIAKKWKNKKYLLSTFAPLFPKVDLVQYLTYSNNLFYCLTKVNYDFG